MKKALFLLLLLGICLGLCACGGISGEKAAELYPDIIGQWGTDPFGEEYTLALSKDGSCTILGTDGTWKLDDKQSNAQWVTLSVKTKNLSYYVRLNRIQEDQRHAYNAVKLLIMDSKQETKIYEGYVFTQGSNFIFPELALKTVPELVGQWGTPYWYEEPILTIREDGSCTVLRQPGKWCLRSDFSTWPKILIMIKLENGLQYEVECGNVYDFDVGFTCLYMSIYNRTEEMPVWINENEEDWVNLAINRNQIMHPMEVASVAVGDWTEKTTEKQFATFREDGTCTIRRADGVWSLDYIAYYDEKFRNGWDYCLHAKISGDEYDICFSDHGSGQYNMYIINQDDGIYILDACEVFKTNAE